MEKRGEKQKFPVQHVSDNNEKQNKCSYMIILDSRSG